MHSAHGHPTVCSLDSSAHAQGVLLTHKAVLSANAAQIANIKAALEEVGPGDVYLSFLPLAHIFDRYTSLCFSLLFSACSCTCHVQRMLLHLPC